MRRRRMRSSLVSTFFSRLVSSGAGINDQTFILSADAAEGSGSSGRQREAGEVW